MLVRRIAQWVLLCAAIMAAGCGGRHIFDFATPSSHAGKRDSASLVVTNLRETGYSVEEVLKFRQYGVPAEYVCAACNRGVDAATVKRLRE